MLAAAAREAHECLERSVLGAEKLRRHADRALDAVHRDAREAGIAQFSGELGGGVEVAEGERGLGDVGPAVGQDPLPRVVPDGDVPALVGPVGRGAQIGVRERGEPRDPRGDEDSSRRSVRRASVRARARSTASARW